MKKSIFTLAAVLSAFSLSSYADTQLALETDPYTFIQGGDSLHLKVSTDSLPNWRFGIGTYSLELPDIIVELNSENDNQDWQVDLTRGVGLFAEYYLDKNQTGWFIGAQVSQQDYQVNSEFNTAKFSNALFMGSLGYKYHLFDTNWYVLPWFGVGYTKTTSGKTARQAAGYDVDPLVGFATLHLGYEF